MCWALRTGIWVGAQGCGGEWPKIWALVRRAWDVGRGTEDLVPCQACHHLGSGKSSQVLSLEGSRIL